ncbi:MAG: AraC family transcriptional regulator, partial [Deltaproteobacteria bacterium]
LVDALAVAIWVPLLRRHAPRSTRAGSERDGGPDRRLRRVEECLRADLAGEHTLDGLAAVAGLSRYHLLRRFKRHYGLPPYAYLTRLRVERAAALALETDLPLTHIALDVGFGSSSRLTEAFQRHYGQAPSRWRHERRAGAISGKAG